MQMPLGALLDKLQNCPCGRKHTIDLEGVEVGRGLLIETADLLRKYRFSPRLLVVADRNTLAAADGILDVLAQGGFAVHTLIYDNLRTAHRKDVDRVLSLCGDADGVLSVGTGSLNDICRRAAFLADKPFAIFATAPSMDGFASDTAPITENNFKVSQPARQPRVVLADTDILAAAPAELKSAGYGDMVAKYIAMADWRIANLTIGEYICPQIADLTRDAVRRVAAMTDRVTEKDAQTAGAILEALVMTGVAMKLCGSSRAASGAEHVVSHFWECKKLEQGLLSDFHGKKVGVASLMITRMYHDLIRTADPAKFASDETDWDAVYAVYGSAFEQDVRRLNTPTVTDETSPDILRENWGAICAAVREEMPDPDTLQSLLLRAGAATTLDEIGVSRELGLAGLRYHAYMRHRLTLARLVPMLRCPLDYPAWAGVR
ncbi:MAG: sn-glycerol-1-phosphate dehydrogenase [Clostridia bacterium]|nr:sn-glycerol-1-phosphate dehydrogenase [Clostridia bacterium]